MTATGRDGAPRWRWGGDNVDSLEAAGGAVLVRDADRLLVLDAATGRLRGQLASDDGAPVPAAALEAAGTTYAVTYERGRIVARLAEAGLLPRCGRSPSTAWCARSRRRRTACSWSSRTATPTGSRSAPRRSAALPGIGLAWRAPATWITGETAGGLILGPPPEPSPPLRTIPARSRPPAP